MTTWPNSSSSETENKGPRFNLARGDSTLTGTPPFEFERVLLNIFPLRADPTTLAGFCDLSLNIAPEFAHFRPSMPFVMMIVAHYPKMSMADKNLGWVSSNEITFAIPIEWYEPEDKRWVLKDYAQYSPYIFVDSGTSQVEGRQVYGWPKMQGWLTPISDAWMEDPRRRRTLLRMASYAFNSGHDNISELLRIRQEAPPSLTVMPPELDGPFNIANSFSEVSTGWAQLLRAWADWAAANAGRAAAGMGGLSSIIGLASQTAGSVNAALQANTVNLKQFRDASAPGMACYQAITNATMSVDRVRRFGMLGDNALLRGDVTGGYDIVLNSYPSLPIADSLGLIGERSVAAGVDSRVLKPILPFWQELDLAYGTANNIAWRAGKIDKGRWQNQNRKQQEKPPSAPAYVSAKDAKDAGPIPYNITGSSGYQVAEGPFEFNEAVVVVLPLLACQERLKKFLGTRLPECEKSEHSSHLSMFGQLPESVGHFEPWGDYVYLIIKHLPEVSSGLRSLGVWSSNMVEFAIPVRWQKNNEEVSVGYVSPFMYSDSDIGSNTARELNGWPCSDAAIESQSNTWLTRAGPFSENLPLLSLKTSMPDALDSNSEYKWQPLLELIGGNMIDATDTDRWQGVAADWGEKLKTHAVKKFSQIKGTQKQKQLDQFQALASTLFDGNPFQQFSLKQFRDADKPENACYQALINTPMNVGKVWDLREIEQQIHLNIFRRPTETIVDTLGLQVKSCHSTQGGIDCLQPIRPFFFKANLEIDHGQKVCWRSGSTEWESELKQNTDMCSDMFERYAPEGAFVESLRWPFSEKVKHEPRSDPQNIAIKRKAWLDSGNAAQTRKSAFALTDHFEPQMAIDSLLSDEWEHWGFSRWFKDWDVTQKVQQLRERLKEKEEEKEKLGPYSVSKEIGKLKERIEALQHIKLAPLPPWPVRCDCVGTEREASFPFVERHLAELEPEYWSPKYKES